MHRVIAGGTGLIGKRLVEHWLKQNHTITVIGRSEQRITAVFGARVKAVSWGKLKAEDIADADIVVNLTGKNVGKRWNEKLKHEIINSRVGSTKKLVSLLCGLSGNIPRFFNASAIGIYGLQPQAKEADQLPPALDEGAPIHWEHPKDFFSLVGTRWEKAADPAIQKGIPVTFLRFGVVLAKEAGALPILCRPVKFYLGGSIGTGKQPFSWVSIDDAIRAIDFLAAKSDITGPVNIVSPQCVQQKIFSKTLARVISRPSFLKVPAFVITTIFGEMGRELILEGQHIAPKRLTDSGFKFLYPDLESALNHILR